MEGIPAVVLLVLERMTDKKFVTIVVLQGVEEMTDEKVVTILEVVASIERWREG